MATGSVVALASTLRRMRDDAGFALPRTATDSSLTVTEPSPYRGDITHLTRSENDALRELRLADLRLEQERIDIQYAERVVCGSCS